MLLYSLSANALLGVQNLENKLFEQNSELSSLQKQMESQEALYYSSKSSFLPSASAVGGWQSNKTDVNTQTEKGMVGYIEAKYNVFNGFKDYSLMKQKNADLNIKKIEFLNKQRGLRIELTSLISEMLHLHELQDILAHEYKTIQTQRVMANKKVSAGLTGPVDNYEFDLRENELQIETNQINQRHEETHQKLVKLFGRELPDNEFSEIKFQSYAELTTLNKIFNYKENLTYTIIEQNLEKTKNEKTQERSDFLPKLDLTASIGRLTPSENTPVKYNESKYGITLTLPLFNGFDTYYKLKSANLNISATEKLLTQKKIEIESEFSILKNKITELDKLFKINDQKLKNSQKYFDLTLGEYRRGIKNSPDLVSATERLFTTKKKQVEILRDLEILKIQIETL